jgi:hypothetical protein
MARRQYGKVHTSGGEERVSQQEERIRPLACGGRKRQRRFPQAA